MFKLFVILIVFIGSIVIVCDRHNTHKLNKLHDEHKQLMEGQKRLFECIKATYEKGADNGKKLDILLRIATNRVDGMTYTE